MGLAGLQWDGVSAFATRTVPLQPPGWTLPDLAGRLVELSAAAQSAHLTAAFGLVLEAQFAHDRAAWVTLTHSCFYPPDVVDTGVDLDAMPVVRVADARTAGRAADHLLRSGGFGLVVIDLADEQGGLRPARSNVLPVPLLARLLGMARHHHAVVLILTRKAEDAPSLHSLVSLRAEATWHVDQGRCELHVRVIKDKRVGPGGTHVETCRGPAGLR